MNITNSKEPRRGEAGLLASQPALGRKLKAVRSERGYSLAEVAAAIDISPSFLSLVENGKNDITIGRLIGVADFYEVRVTDLLTIQPGDRGVVREDERTVLSSSAEGIEIGLLTPNTRRAIMPTFTEIAPGKEATDHLSHEGEEFVYVIGGKVEIEREGMESTVLEAGDSIVFGSTVTHSYRNPGTRPAQLIVVTTPPVF